MREDEQWQQQNVGKNTSKTGRPAACRRPSTAVGKGLTPTPFPGGCITTEIGEDVTEQLDVEPAKFTVHRHVYPQYACRPCETIVAAPAAPAVIDGGMAATGLLAWVLTAKFLDHLPLYRLAQIAARQDVPLALSTLSPPSPTAGSTNYCR